MIASRIGLRRPVRASIAWHCSLATLVLLAALLVLTLGAGVARANAPKLASNGQFSAPASSGIAVDQSTGDVLTASLVGFKEREYQVGHAEKFDASGKPLTPPPPFAEGLHYGAAINPVNGHLYIASLFGEIEVYDTTTGELISSFGVPSFLTSFAQIYENEVQIATDSAGNVYVPNVPENAVLEYSEAGTLLQTFTGSGTHTLKAPTGVAVNAAGDVWVADNGNERIEELSPGGAFMTEFESEGVRALALDGHGSVLAIVDNSAVNCGAVNPPCEHLVDYSESGAQLADVGAGFFGSPEAKQVNESMVAVDEATGKVYVTDGFKNVVWIYQPPLAPVIGKESAVEVGTTEARLGAIVHPGGSQTTYRFEYDTREYRAGEGPHGTSVPLPEGSAGEGFGARTVWASAKNLAPGVTYHYRVVVSNALGTSAGPDQTFTTQTAAQATCPNEPERSGFSAALPNCRAYELVTVPSKSSAEPDSEVGENEIETVEDGPGGYQDNHAANDGDRFSYAATEVMPGSQSAGLEFIAQRGPSGWTSEGELPLRPYTGNRCTYGTAGQTAVLGYSPNLERALVEDNTTVGGFSHEFSESCRGEEVQAVPGEPIEQNLLLRNNESATFQLVDVTPAEVPSEPAQLVAAAADLNVVIFSDQAKLTPDAVTGASNVYEWNEGTVGLLKLRLPSGAPVAGSVAGISPDGSDLVFAANGNLYMRGAGDRTVQLDASRGGAGPGGGAQFASFTADGSQLFFTDDATAGLTADTVAGSGTNLYRYDLRTGELTDLTPAADANASLLAVSENGSYVYLQSDGVLSGAQQNQFGATAQAGRQNIYVDHEGVVTFVVPEESTYARIRISTNGAFMVFNSTESLTGYSGEGLEEIYEYGAATNKFACVSCNPSGETPTAGVLLAPEWVHVVANDGQVFFQTTQALLPRDTNGRADVYAFNYAEDALQLISEGTSASGSILLDANPSGTDLFFLTRQNLVAKDNSEEAYKIYDARVDGGFPEPAVPPACTNADACRPAATPQPPIYGAPPSQTFTGAGNVTSQHSAVSAKAKHRRKRKRCERPRGRRKHARCEAEHKSHRGQKQQAKSHKGDK